MASRPRKLSCIACWFREARKPPHRLRLQSLCDGWLRTEWKTTRNDTRDTTCVVSCAKWWTGIQGMRNRKVWFVGLLLGCDRREWRKWKKLFNRTNESSAGGACCKQIWNHTISPRSNSGGFERESVSAPNGEQDGVWEMFGTET